MKGAILFGGSPDGIHEATGYPAEGIGIICSPNEAEVKWLIETALFERDNKTFQLSGGTIKCLRTFDFTFSLEHTKPGGLSLFTTQGWTKGTSSFDDTLLVVSTKKEYNCTLENEEIKAHLQVIFALSPTGTPLLCGLSRPNIIISSSSLG